MNLDFSKCKTKEDVEAVFAKAKVKEKMKVVREALNKAFSTDRRGECD